MKDFILLGDSHTRSYTSSSKFRKIIFLSQGKKINFASNKAFISYLTMYTAAALNYASADSPLALIIGEPDVRLISYGSYNINKKPSLLAISSATPLPINKTKLILINKSLNRIKNLCILLNCLIKSLQS